MARRKTRQHARLEQIATRICEWFGREARDLPWRRTRSGYSALVAEAMLQQTQVSRVIDRFEAFLARFPTVEDLAAADEQAVLALWQGMGYYRRARHLHQAARLIVERHGGEVPQTSEELRRLPGVGRYTAGAIASLAFGRREPIVDGNVQRVLARLEADDRRPDDSEAVRSAWSRAEALVSIAPDPAALNEGLMELGATICTPASPRCAHCPLTEVCEARRQSRQDEIPPPRTAAERKTVHHHAVIVAREGLVFFEQRPPDGLWPNLWQVPTIESDRALSPRAVAAALPVGVAAPVLRVESFPHQTTHRRITFHVLRSTASDEDHDHGTWRAPDDVNDLPMSTPQRRIVALAVGLRREAVAGRDRASPVGL